MLSSPGTGLSLWAGVVGVFDDDAEDHKKDDDMAPIVVCLSSYCFGVPFFAWLFSSMIMVPSIKMVPPFFAHSSEKVSEESGALRGFLRKMFLRGQSVSLVRGFLKCFY